MKIKIEVRQEHIDSGIRFDSTNCAIANAVRDIFPNAVIGPDIMYLSNSFYTKTILPKKAVHSISRFDGGILEVEPFNFEIDLSDTVIDALCMPDLVDLLKDVDNMELVEA